MKRYLFLLLFIFSCSPALASEKIDLNTASLQQLEEITEVGPVMAQRITDARPFSSIDDLLRVKGIGEKTLQKIKNQGLAYVGIQTQPIITTTPEITYPSGIFINEVLPNPEGADETEEWVELYNSNNTDIDLAGWQIKDIIGTPTTFKIPQNTKILANGFLVFKRPETKIMLNNDGDGLSLLTPDKKIIDSINFASAPLGQSYNRTALGWDWSTTLTPGAKNIITAVAAKTSSKTLSKSENSVKNNNVEAGLADISQAININQEDKTTNPWFLFLAALAITIILASSVLFIKLKFQKNVRT